jgi:hypothetical protein
MANFCILRTAKLRADGNVSASISHALRARETPNADTTIENWTNLNQKGEDGKSHVPDNAFKIAMARFRKTLPQKLGKGRVPCIELMITVSPEVMKKPGFNWVDYLNDADHWAEDTFGKDNVFLRVHHKDEQTPHASIFLVPKVTKTYKDGHTEEVLAAKQWLGGREKLSKLQDDFYEKVGKKYNLERGIKNSKAKHQSQKKYYAKINELDAELQTFSADLIDNYPQTKGMFSPIIKKEELDPYLAKKIETLKPYFKKLATAEDTEKKYKALQEAFDETVDKKAAEKVESEKQKVRDEMTEKLLELQSRIERGNERLNSVTTTVTYKDGTEIECTNGILNGLRERADIAYAFKSLTPYGFKNLAERMEKLNLETGSEAYDKAKAAGCETIGDWLDKPITKSRGYGGMSIG